MRQRSRRVIPIEVGEMSVDWGATAAFVLPILALILVLIFAVVLAFKRR